MEKISRRSFCMNCIAMPIAAGGSVALIDQIANGENLLISTPGSKEADRMVEREERAMKKVGIIICDRWNTCAGGKCLRSLRNREGAFERYKDEDVELVGYTTCGGCPGGNVEYAPDEMKKNGAEIIHLATGLVVGYPPCPHLEYFTKYVPVQFNLEVVVGTHPIPEKYYIIHQELKTWEGSEWKKFLEPTLCDRKTRLSYD